MELREIADILKIRINGLDKKVDNAENIRIDVTSGKLQEMGSETEGSSPLECKKVILNKIIKKQTKSPQPSKDAAMVLRSKSPVNHFRH